MRADGVQDQLAALPAPALTAQANANGVAISGRRKAAILVTVLGDRLSASVLRTMSEEEVHLLTREVSLLKEVSDEERAQVSREYCELMEKPHLLAGGGIEYATTVLMEAFGPEKGKRMAERLMKSLGDETPVIDSLRRADPQHLAKILQQEHPQAIALVLSLIGTNNGARLLSALPDNVRVEVIRRMSALDQISPAVINKVAKNVSAKLRVGGEASLESYGGVRCVAEMLNRIEGTRSDKILEDIEALDGKLAETIRQLMFVFEDLLQLSDEDMRKILANIDRKVLTIALKGSPPNVKKHFTKGLSVRGAEMLEEDLRDLGPVRIREVQAAQQEIIARVKKMQTEGAISLASESDGYIQ